MSFRGTTIRRKIVALLLIPLASLTVIWAFAAVVTGRELLDRPDVKRVADDIGYPGIAATQSLQQERRAAMIYAANPRDSQARIGYTKQQQVTDGSIAKMRTRISTTGVRGDLNTVSRHRLDAFLTDVEGLASLRQRADGGKISRNDVYTAYNDMITPAFQLFQSLNPYNDFRRDEQHHAAIELSMARDQISREDALMAAAISAGHMSAAELKSFTFAVADQRDDYESSLWLLSDDQRAGYDAYWREGNGKTLRAAEDAVIAAGVDNAPIVAAHQSWPSVAATTMDDLNRLDDAVQSRFGDTDPPIATTTIIEAVFVGGIGLVAVIATLFVSVRIGRGLIRDLTGLRRDAQEVSGTRLPQVMRRLAAGEQIDVETEVPRLEYPDDEVGQVGKALNTLQRAVVEATVRQNNLRNGVSEVFVNLARRSQVLLHRQLTLLDAMERRTDDSEELADLFRLDHMTTRMRRHAEGLVILSGAAPSRQWRKPVQLMDVVRAAIAEVEDYERIEMRRLPRLAVAGAAVADLTHLLAELIENAAVFSPPNTTVKLHGEPAANGFVLEIDDRGLGLTPDALLEANLRLAETPEFELSDTDRLGLFVVSRLAQRHSVRVSLRQSPYGGTTAVVMIPDTLLSDTAEDTGSTPVSGTPRLAGPDPAGDTEHTFRQWGLEGIDDIGGEHRKEHAAHPDEPLSAAFGRGLDALGDPAELPPGPGADRPSDPLPLPRRRPRGTGTPVLISDRARRPLGNSPDDDRDGGSGAEDAEDPGATGTAADPVEPSAAGHPDEVPGTPGTPGIPQSRPVAAVPPLPAAGSPQEPGEPEAAADGPGSSLPRRVRQASLAPQLRGGAPRPGPDGADAEGDGTPERSADEVRARMASIQRGWQRGRRAAEAAPGDGPAPAPGPVPEAAPATGDEPAPPAEPAGPAAPTSATRTTRTTPEGNGR
ncbi:nitrate- and nitrite sensing domain-containing protein [Streptomyces sp. NRRL F-5123]|uniref:nitrate- and nitrite sensing domain-containing protein n=1 Tax=Streptomyces sp. NRRL F-5123 TaxID=1463856 RepID=UPI0004E287FA|nr:nitrate- and nitrite sensing domain-containing protein [Streptomyces sp. NRRL F-5123]